MTEPVEKLSIRRLILVPAVITLAVTLLRLVGELQRWSPTLFSREAGGAGALVGIVWLVPIFGIYFAIRLNRAGRGPASRGRAIGYALVALVTAFVLGFAISKLSPSVVANIGLFSLASVLSLWVAYRGWPELGKVEVLYGLAARIPVAIVMLIAMAANWGTHYELGPPGFPEMGLVSKWFLIGLLPQLFLWIPFTVIVGSLFGSLALFFQKRRQVTDSAAHRGSQRTRCTWVMVRLREWSSREGANLHKPLRNFRTSPPQDIGVGRAARERLEYIRRRRSRLLAICNVFQDSVPKRIRLAGANHQRLTS